MNEEVVKNRRPVIEGLFTWPSDNPQLYGTRCISCNSYYFPKKLSCNNPHCKEKKAEEVLLSTRGKLWSYTVMRHKPQPPFMSDSDPPYPMGLVELSEGIRVAGLITGCEFEDLKVGIDMELVIETLYHDEEGQEVVTWKFRPIDKKD